ncbi:MAG TPA: flavodoxin domain-containing protein [Chitinophagaceae bacterium]|nr:flavodoxin domain-containing protein [Chitinophagaceae bacterium]
MLVQNKMKTFLDLVGASTKEELIWMNGYLSGMVSRQTVPQPAATVSKQSVKITIAYGTETGHSKKLAAGFAARAKQKGINAKLVSLDQYRPTDLAKEEYFLTVLSTHGEGEPPAAAKKFYDHIHQNGFRLDKLKYGVLALGDTAYPLFCKAGEDVDLQLNKLGAQRIVSLHKCDTDYEAEADGWFSQVLQKLSGQETGAAPALPQVKKAAGKKIYTGTVLSNINLNDRGSDKETRHIEIAADGVVFQPGDSIGVVPKNNRAVVDAVMELSGCDRLEQVYELLTNKLNIVHLPERIVKRYAGIVQQDIPATRIGLVDLLKIYPLNNAAQFEEVINILEPITPRLYSISSSPEAHSNEVHVTVARDTFRVNGEMRYGLCSDYLAALPADSTIDFYIHANDQFRLPEDDKDIIMIGPGTGLAPFRSFLAHRDANGAAGRNWLFFGDRHFITDFLYQTELQNWKQTGLLTHLHVAFSRDQQQKIYVQHKMLEHGAALFEWIDGGAHVYVCGAKQPMSVDVENTLLYIIKQHGQLSVSQAEQYLERLKEDGRYLKDVY